MSTLHQFNPGRKSWKIYSNTITSISGDDLTLTPYDGKNLILEVSGNNEIIFKKGDTSYNLSDLSNISGSSGLNGIIDVSGISTLEIKGDLDISNNKSYNDLSNNNNAVLNLGQLKEYDTINNSFNELVSINTSVSTSTWDGTTTLLNQISTTNLRHFGHSSKITKDGQFAFIGEVSTSLNGAIIHIYQKNSSNGTYSTYSTQSSISIDDFADYNNHAARCHGFDISEDGSIIVVLHNNLIEDSNMTSIYAIIYYYDSTSSTWVLTSQTSNATKRSNNTIRGILLGNLTPTNTSGSSHPVHRLLNTRIKFLSKDGTKLAIHIANGGTSYSTGLVAVYTITINGINTTINTNGTSGSRALVNIVPPAGTNISFSYHYSPAAIANNGYVLVTGIDQDAIDARLATGGALSGNEGYSGFTALLYSTDIANNSSTLVWKFLTPFLTMDYYWDEAGTGCYIDNKYLSFSDPYADNPESATNNYGATWVFDYTDRISSSASTETWSQTATNPEVVLLSDGTLTSHSFYVSDTNNGYGGLSQCQIREYASDLYIILGSSNAYGGNRGTVEIWKYSNSSWTNTSELTYDSGKGTSVFYGQHVGLADDTILVAAPGGWSGQYGSYRYVEFHSLNLTTTTTTTTGQITGNTKIVGNLEVTGTLKAKNQSLEELYLCPTEYSTSSAGDIDTTSGYMSLSDLVTREPVGVNTQLHRLSAIHTVNSSGMVVINGTTILSYLPPVDTNRLLIKYEYQIGFNNDSDAIWAAVITASYMGGTYYPILNSIRGDGQTAGMRMDTPHNIAIITHDDNGTSEAHIKAGKLKIKNLSTSEYWNFRLEGTNYYHSDFGAVDVHDAHNLFQGYMFPSSYLPTGVTSNAVLTPPHITVRAFN